ncbi:hypothetical protein CICLE_v10030529mg [Citrus x clementina]|uniref:Disease resistance RPP13-like protein 1 n=1 Tax=Citrus clementina TaxID=85681 RepID=V4VHW3_CITCL|nr:putative disease resistance RPP13-like protein 1 [Citrus x clementina]ESR52179.1 hypothetical protein CICLE_v10030529mg [Citrus x clementina]
MPVAEVFLSAFLQVLFDRLASPELLNVATRWKIDAELKNLTLLASKINVVLRDAEEKQVKDMAVRMWLDELRDVADDAEDVLDEFSTEILRCRLEAERQENRNPLNGMFSHLNVFFNLQLACKIKSVTERLGDIVKQKAELGLRDDTLERPIGLFRRIPTTSLVDDRIYGREEDADKLIDFLLKDVEATDDGMCVIPLVGMGGVGKTTLAQVVYKDEKVNDHFELKAWAFVSDEFDLVKVTKAILESLGESCGHITQLEPLQSALKRKLTLKRYLLVLDDLWGENYNEWEVLQLPFRGGAHGSKIIVTTRSENVAQIVGTVPVFHLQELSDNDCWSLFAQHAFSKLNPEARPSLESIGKEIAKKCKGLPLAAKALGGLLRSKSNVDEWQHILNSEVWELPDEKTGILPGLALSYHHLPSHLKPCFAYCAIFPKGYEFEANDLVRLWMAEGLMYEPRRNMQNEDVGSHYFHDLLSRSLFQRSSRNISRFIMHDLINDLAQFAAGERCLRLEDNSQHKNHAKARHLSYIRQRRDAFMRFEAFRSHKYLRTFLPLDGGFGICRITKKVTHDLLKNFSRLRVLSLSHYEIVELPDLIGDLKHLRYLDLSNTSIKSLPESIAALYNLQTLILYSCRYLIQLPKHMGDLFNLRFLDIRGCNLQQLPPHMGGLKNLRTLPSFLVSKDGGCGIRELKDLSKLKGDLSIIGLENVDKDTDAEDANLKDKKYLNKLELQWSSGHDGMIDEDVLEALQPHWNLKELSIKQYSGAKFPRWAGDPSYSNLVFLSLINCRNCTYLPPLGQLPSLKNLIIEGMDAISRVGPEFYADSWLSIKSFQSLEALKFKDLPVWEEWISPDVGEFPHLHELCIENCPKFSKEIPRSLVSLKTLEILNCRELSWIPCLPQIQNLILEECGQVILESIVDLTSLVKLRLYKILSLRCLASEFFHRLTVLHDLQLVNCDELLVLSNQFGLLRNSSLRRLAIWKCSISLLWPEEGHALPDLLECLEIGHCDNLHKLPDGLHSLKSLNTLKIINCPSLAALPEIDASSSLRYLQIQQCEALRSLPAGLTCNKNLSLEFFELDGCSSLISFPDGELPLTLQHLKISNCPNLNFLPAGLLHKNTCLECLQISGCSLNSFPVICSSNLSSLSASSPKSSSRLKMLEICNCMDLISLPDDLYNFICLDKLLISNCPKLVSFPAGGLPPNLKSLSISDCENLVTLPNQMHSMTSLQDLTISNCIHLESFPEGGLPPNLKSLCIIECINLEAPSKWDLHKLRSIENFLISNASSSHHQP